MSLSKQERSTFATGDCNISVTLMSDRFSPPRPIIVSLKQVAAWDLEHLNAPCEIKASVPALQRGLVWSPNQVELLWDSILRGFPIGSFVVSKKVEDQERSGKSGITHHLLDGQQRCNAITLGFHDAFADDGSQVRGNKSESILWIDLAPSGGPASPYSQFQSSSTREFLTRVTTRAHPWGYRSDDSAWRLSAAEARESLEWEFEGKTRPSEKPSPRDLLPWHTNAPVPLSWLMSAVGGEQSINEEAFWAEIRSRLEQLSAKHRWPTLALEVLSQETCASGLHAIYRGICRAAQTRLVIMEAPDDILVPSRLETSGQKGESGDIASIEHLFNRLNRLGTQLAGEELAYSMIKAYWPRVADVIDSVTVRRIPASHLASLGVRAALTPNEGGKLARGIGITRLRAIAKAEPSHEGDEHSADYNTRLRIEQFLGAKYPISVGKIDEGTGNRLAEACEQVDRWLVFNPETSPNGLPPVLVSSFARGSSDSYLFLLHIADRLKGNEAARDRRWNDLLPGLATLVHWFCKDGEELAIADLLLEAVAEGVSPDAVHAGLANAIRKNKIITPRQPGEIAEFIALPEDEGLAGWGWWQSLIEAAPEEDRARREEIWWPFLAKTVWQRELLLYAQRGFLHRAFPDYDPSRKDLWEDHNRPWDFDHLHAHAYFYNAKSGGYAGLCREWGNAIGNLRAWPFEENRSDQRKTAKEKLGGRLAETVDSLIESEVELAAFSYGNDARHNSAAARALCEAIKARFIRIYRDWYESTGVSSLLS